MPGGDPTTVRLKVVPGASRTAWAGRHGDRWRVRVAAPPEGGKANEAVLALLAERLGVPRGRLALVAGHGSPLKTVTVTGLAPEEVEARLSAAR